MKHRRVLAYKKSLDEERPPPPPKKKSDGTPEYEWNRTPVSPADREILGYEPKDECNLITSLVYQEVVGASSHMPVIDIDKTTVWVDDDNCLWFDTDLSDDDVDDLLSAFMIAGLYSGPEASAYDDSDGSAVGFGPLNCEIEVRPSSSPNCFHVLINKALSFEQFLGEDGLLQVLTDVGLVEQGYTAASRKRGYSAIRRFKKPPGLLKS